MKTAQVDSNWEKGGITEVVITVVYYEFNYIPQISYVEAPAIMWLYLRWGH